MTDRELMQQALGCEEVHPECKKTRRREWVGLTDEEKRAIRRLPWETPADLIDNTEAKLREKNT